MFKKTTRAFTLLEILLVVGIIVVLAAIVIIAINPNKQLANVRNAQRLSDLKQINNAIMQYYIDHSAFPSPTTLVSTLTEICNTGSVSATTTAVNGEACGTLVNLSDLVPTYLVAIPVDPLATSTLSFFNKIIPTVYAASRGTAYKAAVVNNQVTSKAYLGEGTNIFVGPVLLAETCTSFNYSAWSNCVNGVQTRTIINPVPLGCTGGISPILSQNCVLPSITYSGLPLYISPVDSGQAQWGCYGTSFPSTQSETDGAANTFAIVAGCAEANRAARICSDLNYGGYTDWYLPSRVQLTTVYNEIAAGHLSKGDYTPQWINFLNQVYWSSNEYSGDPGNFAWWVHFGAGGNNSYYYKDSYPYIRCVRAD